jgi:hypothetical protein
VIPQHHTTNEPAALPRPGPSGTPFALAHRQNSSTTRKYPAKPMRSTMASSEVRRSL